jgi:hypothetical protein
MGESARGGYASGRFTVTATVGGHTFSRSFRVGPAREVHVGASVAAWLRRHGYGSRATLTVAYTSGATTSTVVHRRVRLRRPRSA